MQIKLQIISFPSNTHRLERAIRRVKEFDILSGRCIIPATLAGSANQIWTVCALLTKLMFNLLLFLANILCCSLLLCHYMLTLYHKLNSLISLYAFVVINFGGN